MNTPASTAPKAIYLDIGDRAALESIEAGGPWETEGVTWSEDNATGDGIRYVRADLASRTLAPAALSPWQPIESVPGTQDDILLMKATGGNAIETGWHARNLLMHALLEGDTCVYTAWMHFPAAIAASKQAEQGKEATP